MGANPAQQLRAHPTCTFQAMTFQADLPSRSFSLFVCLFLNQHFNCSAWGAGLQLIPCCCMGFSCPRAVLALTHSHTCSSELIYNTQPCSPPIWAPLPHLKAPCLVITTQPGSQGLCFVKLCRNLGSVCKFGGLFVVLFRFVFFFQKRIITVIFNSI